MIQLIIEMTNAPIIAEVNEATVKPLMICATNQKNAPLRMMEKSPSVRIFNGNVKIPTIGLMTMLINTKQAPTNTAVKILLTVIPATKNGKANMANVVINQRRRIIKNDYTISWRKNTL
jgi:hypothetical protein